MSIGGGQHAARARERGAPGRHRYRLAPGWIVVVLLALVVACGGEAPDRVVTPVTPVVTAAPRVATAPPRVASPPPSPATPAAAIEATPEPTPSPTPTDTPTPVATPIATPVATPEPVFEPVEALVVAATTSHAAPSMSARVVRNLSALSTVSLVAEEYGQNWIIGDQDWVPLSHDWETTWYRLDDGSYVYRAFVLLPDGVPPAGNDRGERYVIVDLQRQTAWAMVASTIVREMPVTTGKPGFETPTGEFRVLGNGRILNERMTSQRAGFDDPNDRYDVQRVLYTQYFAEGGFALHLNYWQPEGIFGGVETSHGCIGMLLADAQFLWAFGSAGMRVVVRDGGGPVPLPPTPGPTPRPTATPEPAVKIFAVQDGAPNSLAIVAARTTPGAACSLAFTLPSGERRDVPGGATRTADAGGWLEWKWTIESTPPGKGSVTIGCPGGGATAEFHIR